MFVSELNVGEENSNRQTRLDGKDQREEMAKESCRNRKWSVKKVRRRPRSKPRTRHVTRSTSNDSDSVPKGFESFY
jgi:hypothetical protein